MIAQGESCIAAGAVGLTTATTPVGQSAARYAGPVAFTVTNPTRTPICMVQMGPSSNPDWGDNWLAASEQIPPHGSRVFRIAAGQRWDVQVTACQGSATGSRRNIDVPPTGRTVELRGARSVGAGVLGLVASVVFDVLGGLIISSPRTFAGPHGDPTPWFIEGVVDVVLIAPLCVIVGIVGLVPSTGRGFYVRPAAPSPVAASRPTVRFAGAGVAPSPAGGGALSLRWEF
jgi:hypothetical protein